MSVQGTTSTTYVQQSYPNFNQSGSGPGVTVYAPGTTTKVTLYSDNSGTALGNPFPCSATGTYTFYSPANQVDILFSGTGVSSFTIPSVNGGSVVVSATNFGAIANGTGSAGTDQTAKIQSAINLVHNLGGGTVFFPASANCYVVTYPGLSIYSNITIDGPGACIQNMHAAFSDWPGGFTMFQNDVTVSGLTNFHIRHVTIDGNRANITGLTGADLNAFGVSLFGASNSSVENAVIENAGDNLYMDCAGSPRTTAGSGVLVTGNLFTNAQRNNISVICGTNIQISGNELSLANGAAPQTGIDVEENIAGQAVTGLVITQNNVHDNTKEGILVQPAHDSANTLNAVVTDNLVYNNGWYGIHTVNFTGVAQALNLNGNISVNNTTFQIFVSGWSNTTLSGVTATGSAAVALELSSTAANVVISGGYYSGGTYDIEVDSTSTPIAASPRLAHGKVHGLQYFRGLFSPTAFDPATGIGLNYSAGITVPTSTTLGNGNVFQCEAASVGSGATLTAQRCVFIPALTGGSFNIGVQSEIAQGTNNYGLWMHGTALNYLNTGWQGNITSLSTLQGLFPCNSTNYGHVAIINDAMSATFNSAITGGGTNVGLAVCSSADAQYHFH